MQHTSDKPAAPTTSPFFLPEQVFAFSQPPSDLAVNQVKKQGSDQDYLPGEYIRLLLNSYIGAGMYDLDVQLAGPLHIETVQKPKFENRQKVGMVDNVAVTANVAVTIKIYAADGSGRTRTYSAVGSHTMYGAAESGAGAIIGNAIKSAETSGLKRAVQPLGRAFGLDLKNKVSKAMMPPGIKHFRKMLDDQLAAAESSQPRLAAPSGEYAEPRPSQNGTETLETVERVETAPVAQPAAEPKAAERPAARADRQPAPVEVERADAAPVAATGREPRKAAEPAAATPASEVVVEGQPAAIGSGAADPQQAGHDGAPVQAEAEPEWELSMTPTNYAQWVACIKTMTKRLALMTSEREISNFVRRNSKLIDAMPFYPAKGDDKAKDFPDRWKTIMARRYQSLGFDVPAQYAPADGEKVAQQA